MLGFANFYIRFIKNFSRIVIPLILMLWTADDGELNFKTSENEINHDIPGNAGFSIRSGTGGENFNRSIKIL